MAIPAYPNEEGKLVPERIQFQNSRAWKMPEGTVLLKTLSIPTSSGLLRAETQMLTLQNGDWAAYVYKWNEEGTDALLVDDAGENVVLKYGDKEIPWRHASRAECMFCHSRAAGFALGMDTLQINREHSHSDPTLPKNQLAAWDKIGLFSDNWAKSVRTELEEKFIAEATDEEKLDSQQLFGGSRAYSHPLSDRLAVTPQSKSYAKQVDPYDLSQPLEERAWSYLHTNCANCHTGAGGGNAAINLAINVVKEKREVFDVVPKHLHFDLPDAKIIAPGKPSSSVLLHRMELTGPGKMPIIGRNTVDQKGIQLIREWVLSMESTTKAMNKSDTYPRFRFR